MACIQCLQRKVASELDLEKRVTALEDCQLELMALLGRTAG